MLKIGTKVHIQNYDTKEPDEYKDGRKVTGTVHGYTCPIESNMGYCETYYVVSLTESGYIENSRIAVKWLVVHPAWIMVAG